MSTKIGAKCKLYIDLSSTGNIGNATWSGNSAGLVSDADLTMTYEMATGTTRGSPVVEKEPTQPDIGVSGMIRCKVTDAVYNFLGNAAFGRTAIGVLSVDGDIADSVAAEGVAFLGKISEWSQPQKLNDVTFRSFKIEPCVDSGAKRASATGNTVTLSNFT